MGATGKVLQLGAEAALGAGKQFFKKMKAAKTLPKLSGIVTEDLTKHIDTLKPEDYAAEISNIETMFKGMKNGDDASYAAFDEFASTKMVANKYQQNVSELEKAYKPKTDAEKSLYVSKLDTPTEEGYKAADPEQFQQWTKREAEHFAEHGKASKERFILEHETDPTKNIEYKLDNKGVQALDGILSQRSFSVKNPKIKNIENKTSGGNYRAKTKGAQITEAEYIEELGEELGRLGYKLDKARMKRLRRWIGKKVHLDHIQPISQGGFDHPANMILLYAKDNLSKNAKVLPDEFFTSMKIPRTKAELIRLSIKNTEIPNKIKRQMILEGLNIVK